MIHDFSCRGWLIWHSDTIIIYLANSSWLRLIHVNLMCYRLVLRDQTHAEQLLRMTSPSFVVDQSLKMCNYKWPASFFIQSVCMCLSFKLSVSPSLMNSCGFVSLCGGMLGWPQLCVWAVQTRRPHLSLCMHGAHPYLRTTLRQDSAA